MTITLTAVSGYREVGRNMTGVSLGNDTIALDNGIRLDTLQIYDESIKDILKLSKEELVNYDIIPQASRLKNVRAQVISHGHLDHIGGLSFNKPKVPIYTTHYASEIGRKEYANGDFISMDYGERRNISQNFSVEFIEVTHSIPQASIVVLHSKMGKIVYACDFRFDDNSTIAKVDYKKLKKLGGEDVSALIVESTRVANEGKTPSESLVQQNLRDTLKFIEGGLITASTFASHIERIQTILDEVEKTGRKTIILGRSLLEHTELADRFGLLDLPLDAKIVASEKAANNELRKIKNREKYFLLVTGHQGEPKAALSKLVDGKYNFKFRKDDSVLLCADTIPTPMNEANRYVLETKLKSKGVRIFKDIHVSGHAAKEDHRKLIRMVKPKNIIPCHGTLAMRSKYAELAAEEGYQLGENVHLLNNGQKIRL